MNTLQELKRSLKGDLSRLPKIKIALAGDTATQLLATAIKGTGVIRGYNIDLFETEYNQVEQQLLIPTSDLHQFDADFIVIMPRESSTEPVPSGLPARATTPSRK